LARSHNLGSAVIVKYIPRNDRETCWGREKRRERVRDFKMLTSDKGDLPAAQCSVLGLEPERAWSRDNT